MTPRIPLLAFSLTLLALSCADAGSEEVGTSSAQATVPGPVACGAALPGPALMPGAVESDPSFAERLAAMGDFPFVLDAVVIAPGQGFAVDLATFMLGAPAGATVWRFQALAAGGLGRSVLGATEPALAMPGQARSYDATFLRQGLYRHYLCQRPIPASLPALVARYGDYTSWPAFDVPCSKAKDGPRRIYEDETQGVFVAETLVDGGVRETEVIFSKLRDDQQLDFAAYTDQGALTDRSTFAASGGASVTLAAPFTCMTCHYDRNRGTFSRRLPIGTGAGCAP